MKPSNSILNWILEPVGIIVRHARGRTRVALFAGVLVSSVICASLVVCDAQPPPARVSSNDRTTQAAVPVRNPVSANAQAPTYLGEVMPILMGKCARCHDPESAVMPNWLDYKTALARKTEIKRRVWDSWKGVYFRQTMPAGNGPESLTMTEAERATIRNWVEAGAPYGVQAAQGGFQSKSQRIEHGKQLFGMICATCHQPTGQGIPGRFPPLAGSDFLNADKHRAIRALLHGLQGEITVNGQAFNNSMPRFPLTDHDIASALTYVYNSFGNSGTEVTPEEVSVLRTEPESSQPGPAPRPKTREEPSPFE